MTLATMQGIYRQEGAWTLIEIKLHDSAQLFHSLDPSPFRERDLDPDAAEYLINAFRELHGHQQVKIVIYLPQLSTTDNSRSMQEAIKNYFLYRQMVTQFQVKQRLRLGRNSFLVGLVFLFICNFIRLLLPPETMSIRTISEGLLIIGWVAMWKPIDILLYEWWPLANDARLYQQLSELPIEVRVNENPTQSS